MAGRHKIYLTAELALQAQRNQQKAWHKKHRKNIIELLGGCCQRCGFTDERALQIDHVNGGGYREWFSKGNRNNRMYFEEIKANRDKYQLLCANCNWIKRAEQNENKPGLRTGRLRNGEVLL